MPPVAAPSYSTGGQQNLKLSLHATPLSAGSVLTGASVVGTRSPIQPMLNPTPFRRDAHPINGAEVIHQARARRPRLPIVLPTGYADRLEVGRVPPADATLFKPFDVAALLRAVRDACHSGAVTSTVETRNP